MNHLLDTGADVEVAAIAQVATALAPLGDSDARRRVLTYVLARYAPDLEIASRVAPMATATSPRRRPLSDDSDGSKELPGIAQLGEDGDLVITIRDLKARSSSDAAKRLALIAIYAHQILTGEAASSRKLLTPLLKQWRLYSGNSRTMLAKEKGLIRKGDILTLDAHAKRDAEKYVAEILDDQVAGTWKPR